MKLCLIIDASSVVRKVAGCILNTMGYEVTEAGSGADALAVCGERMPDAILLDWDLPDMSGFDFIVEFKRQFACDLPHTVYVTTENDPLDISRSIGSGASDFLIKPFDRTAIEAKFPQVARAA